MKIDVESVSPVEKKVTIEVDPEHVAKELDEAYVGLGQRVKLRGFRPGKAPRKVLERQFRSEVEREVAEKIVEKTLAEAVRVRALGAVGAPRVSISEGVNEGKPLRFTARVEVRPDLAPKDYRGLNVKRRPPAVAEEQIDAEIAKIQDATAQLAPIEDRLEAREGDWAIVSHEGTVDGEAFEGSRAAGVVVKVAPGKVREGNLAALAGKKPGDVVEVEETFAADHGVEALRGKTAKMKVTLSELKTRVVPSLDDAFAKSLGVEGVETLEQLRARIRGDLMKQEERRAENELRDAIVKAALARNEFEVPPVMVEQAIDTMLRGAADRFARQGVDIRKLGLDVPRLRADMREQALLQVRGALLLNAIAEAEKVVVTDEDVQAEIAMIAGATGAPLAQVQQQWRGPKQQSALRIKILEDKTIALLASAANVESP